MNSMNVTVSMVLDDLGMKTSGIIQKYDSIALHFTEVEDLLILD